MKTRSLMSVVLLCLAATAIEAEPLRVFVRAGPKTHGPGAHDHPAFLRDWVPLLNERGMKADGALEFPTAEQLERTDVLIIHCDHGGDLNADQRAGLDKFLKRGGGLVSIHAGCVSKDHDWYKPLIGGSWHFGQTKWHEGPMSLYFADPEHPITRGASNFDLDDEIYYDMDLAENIRVLAAAYTPNPRARDKKAEVKAQAATAGGKRVSVYDIQPQMWTYENTLEGGKPYRAFVCIPGHLYTNFSRPNFRAILLRGIAWAGGREDVDTFCTREELAALRFPLDGPSTPADSAARTVVHPEFTMKLVASEPLVNKVMNVDWDPQGRMWCVETPEYPNGRRQPREEPWKDSGSLVRGANAVNRPARDRVSMLVDTDGDGVADKKEIFFEGLELVTSMVFHRDGVIVSQSPDVLFLRDTDGDGKADKVETLYTGLGAGDTHATLNNLRWGMDGWIYATLGYSAGHPRSPDGSKDFGNMSSGVVRFRPDGSAFEQVSSKGGNTWGLDLTWDNEVFFTQPTSGQVFMHVVTPESVLARARIGKVSSYRANVVGQKSYPLITYEKQAYVQIDQVGQFTAAAGCAIYDGGSWPAKWTYSYFTTEPTINIIHHETVTPDGPSFLAKKEAGREETEFIASRDYWWRPIETRIGPDGALYICDFYNQAVVHNDTRGPHHGPANAAVRPDRDHYFARIWRVDHKEAKKLSVPRLGAQSSAAELLAALEHPNSHVRENAVRLMAEGARADIDGLAKLAGSRQSPAARVAALWTLYRLQKLSTPVLQSALADADAALRKNAAQIAGLLEPGDYSLVDPTRDLEPLLADADPRVRLQAIVALGSGAGDALLGSRFKDSTIAKLVSVFAAAQDDWTRSAIARVAAREPARFLPAAMAASDTAAVQSLVTALSASLADTKNPAAVAGTVISLSRQPASADALKQALLPTLVNAPAPAWSDELRAALAHVLSSPDAALAASALPVTAAWDKGQALKTEAADAARRALALLQDAKAATEVRSTVGANLLAARSLSPEFLPTVLKVAAEAGVPALQSRLVTALGDLGGADVGAALIALYPKSTDATLRETLLNQFMRRADWSLAMVEALKAKQIALADLGPIAAARLRTHPDKKVADAAVAAINELRGPQTKAKDEIIARVLPVAQQPPNLANGKALFTSMCLICHAYKGEGRKEFAPDLTGMGLHGVEQILTAVIDPNREVDPSFLMQNVTTKKGESFSGIIARENAGSILLRHAGGEVEIAKADIASRVNAGISMMPDGLESLGPENLRDIVGYLTSDTGNFRLLDLSKVFSSDTRQGLYASQATLGDTLPFAKFGVVTVKGVPFNIVSPEKSPTGRNVLTLGGGHGYAKTLPKKAEIKVGFAASRLHFLGGIGGWAARQPDEDGAVVLKITVVYADGQREEFTARNGVEFADYNAHIDVPGSMLAEGVVQGAHQARAFTRVLKSGGIIDRIELENPAAGVAPTTIAITAEIGAGAASLNPDGTAAAPAAQARPALPNPPVQAAGPRVLMVGGGSSHNFERFFHQADKAILSELKPGWIDYTDQVNGAPSLFANVDVLVWSSNQGVSEETARALKAWADAGKPLVIVHPGVWYNWKNFPAWNREIVGGGSRGHDAIGEFEVKAVNPAHPVMSGVPASFRIVDELYYMIPDEQGTAIEVLATATSPKSGKTFPSVWVVKHPKARIVCLAPGHDERVHDHAAYRKLLQNAVTWAVGK